jgi:hypothetical protein
LDPRVAYIHDYRSHYGKESDRIDIIKPAVTDVIPAMTNPSASVVIGFLFHNVLHKPVAL